MLSRREVLAALAVSPLMPSALVAMLKKPELEFIDVQHIFHAEPVIIGHWIKRDAPWRRASWFDQSEVFAKPEDATGTPYVERQVTAFIYEKFAGWGNFCRTPRIWGEIEMTERHRRKEKRTCSDNCLCRTLDPSGEMDIWHVEWKATPRTNYGEDVPYNYRENGIKRHPCTFCGSDDAFCFRHDDSKYMSNSFSCSDCQDRLHPVVRDMKGLK